MRKLILVAAVALMGCLILSGCGKKQDDQQASEQTQKVARPTDMNDAKAWNAYLVQLLNSNLEGMKANQPYAYMVKAGDGADINAQNQRQLDSVQETVARGVLPGNLLAFAGPDSSKTADLLTTAFQGAKAGSFKDVIILFIGDKADQQRVASVIKPTGATFRFVQM